MKIALVQMDVRLGEIEHNLNTIIDRLAETRKQNAQLTLFPECALTGYCFDSLDEAREVAQPLPGPATQTLQNALKEQGRYAIFGMLEADGERVYNAAVLMNGQGIIATYRKIHLPGLGIDQFLYYGDHPFAVHDIEGVQIGLGICYDSAFPESIRVMSLMGADLIALPTNFPSGAEGMVDHTIRTRAMENNVYFACCNRVGEERGFRFIGGSQIVNPDGTWQAHATETSEEILYGEVDPERARNKRVTRVPGKHVIDRFADRRPEMYDHLTRPHSLPRRDNPAP